MSNCEAEDLYNFSLLELDSEAAQSCLSFLGYSHALYHYHSGSVQQKDMFEENGDVDVE